MKKKRLTTEELAVVEALARDVAATVGVSDQAAYTTWLIAETLDLLSRTTQRHDLLSARDYVVDDFQQRMHDEFIDVSWPRCPRHPNHPRWLNAGAWWCTYPLPASELEIWLGVRDGIRNWLVTAA